MERVDIIIVNWNSGDQLRECLAALAGADKTGIALERVCVVDNASDDGSMDGVEREGLPLEVIRNPVNRGYAAACNQGAAKSRGDYLLLLNPDTRVFVGSLRVPIEFMKDGKNKEVGIAGIQNVDANGRVMRTCGRFLRPDGLVARSVGLTHIAPRLFPDHLMTEWSHRDSREVDHVMGSFFLVRRDLWDALGGFDERFFVYLEDMDFSLRAHQKGYKSWYLCDAQVYHKGGGTSEKVKATRLFYSLRSRLLYANKHFGAVGAASVTIATLLPEPVTRVVWAFLRGRVSEAWETLRAYVMLLRSMPLRRRG